VVALRLMGAALASLVAVQTAARAQAPEGAPLAQGADARSWEAHFDAGVAVMRRQPTVALASFELASRLDPTRAEPLFARFVAFWMANSIEDFIAWRQGNEIQRRRPEVRAADSLFALALQRNPFVHRGLEILLYDRMPGRFRRDRDTRAWVAYSTGNFADAVKLHTQTIERNPQDAIWQRYDRALSLVMANNLQGAQSDIEAILDELRRQEASAEDLSYYRSKHALLHMLGLLQVQRGDLATARATFGEALLENAGFAYAQAALANVSRMERKPRDAVTEFSLALELAPDDAVLRWQHAQALFDAGRYDASVAEATLAAEREPLWAAPYLVIGRARERQRRTEQMTAAYAAYVARAPETDPTARSLRQRVSGLTP
jgi:tetratricopeptide (TPR) repeat protein